MNRIADDFDGFVENVSAGLRVALNSPVGQKLIGELLDMKLKQNPDMSKEEWQRVKSEFMTFLFCQFVQDCPGAMQELAGHVWEELRKEDRK